MGYRREVNVGGGRIVVITMATALRLAALSAINVGLSKCRIKLIKSKGVRCFRCDGLGHIMTINCSDF